MWLASTLIWLSILVALPAPAHARCDPTTEPDKSDIANARAAPNKDMATNTGHTRVAPARANHKSMPAHRPCTQ